jgi:hypothetical protein
MKRENTKTELLKAFDQSEKKSAADVCRIVGIVQSTYYFHLYKDPEFRRQVLEKKREYLTEKIEGETINRGENV